MLVTNIQIVILASLLMNKVSNAAGAWEHSLIIKNKD